MFVQERLPNDITSLRIAEVSSIAVESLRKCQFQRQRAKVKHNVGFAIKYYYCPLKVIDHQKIKAGILARMSAFLCYFAFTTKHKQL